MIAWAMRLLRRNTKTSDQPDGSEKYKRQAKERDAWEEMRELELRGETMKDFIRQIETILEDLREEANRLDRSGSADELSRVDVLICDLEDALARQERLG